MNKKVSCKKEREVDAMSTAVKLRASENQYLDELETYIVKLKDMKHDSAEDAYQEAKKALLRTGVVTRSGKRKEKIVSWE